MALHPKIAAEWAWLKANPQFAERPATLLEFLGPEYLNVEFGVRVAIRQVLREIMGDEVDPQRPTKFPLAMFTGAIGIGKTTVASIVLPYLVHWTLCLKNPQGYFSLLPGSRIAFMEMSTSAAQAREVIFGDIKARIQHSKWFRDNYPYDPALKNQLRFPKDVWILPGDSQETTFEGYNIMGGILDEADSHKITIQGKDYGELGYATISNRITSRFGDRGFLLVIGQMKSSVGFAARKYNEFKRRPDAYTRRMTIWESFGPDHYEKEDDGRVKVFFYDTHRKKVLPYGVGQALRGNANVLEVPQVYRKEFEVAPERALKDLAGIPPAVGDPFISLVDRIMDCSERWEQHNGHSTPVNSDGRIAEWFKAPESLPRAIHIDLAYAENGDNLGLSMGHVRELVVINGEEKPYIVIDFIMRMSAPPGGEIFLSDVRQLVYNLRDYYKFRIKKATLDGFQSQDTIQQFRRRKIEAEYVSVDKDLLPYHDLREAIYEGRIEFPKYMVHYHRGDEELVEIALKELSELIDDGRKIDHPPEGSKDVSDSLAGVTFTLMGERSYRKAGRRLELPTPQPQKQVPSGGEFMRHPAFLGDNGLHAPVPPRNIGGRIP